jgi:hypothetical protein
MNIVFGRRDADYFIPLDPNGRARAEEARTSNDAMRKRIDELAEKADKVLHAEWEAKIAHQAQQQSDHEKAYEGLQTETTLDGIKFKWSDNLQRWFLAVDPDNYAAWIEKRETVPYHLSVEEMADLQGRAYTGERDPVNEAPRTLGDILRAARDKIEDADGSHPHKFTWSQPNDADTWSEAADEGCAAIQFDVEVGDVVELRSGSPHMTVECMDVCQECGRILDLGVMWWDFNESRIMRDRVKPENVDHIEA